MSFSHISLNVSDLEETTEFWLCTLNPLGFVKADGEDGEYQRISNGRDTVVTFGSVDHEFRGIPANQKTVGLYHIAFLANSKQQVDALARHITALGVPLIEPGVDYMEYRGGYYSFAFHDPDSFEIEIVFHGTQYFDP